MNPRTTTAPAAPQEKPPKEITINEFRPFENKATRGFFDMTLPNGMILYEWILYENDNGRWVKAPSKPIKDSSGILFKPYADFIKNTEIRKQFNSDVLAALDRYFAEARP